MNKIVLTLLGILSTSAKIIAQPEVEMADAFRADGKIYVVVSIILLIFAGLIAYLVTIDRKVSRLEKSQQKK